VIGRRPSIELEALTRGAKATDVAGATVGTRQVWFEQGGWHETPILSRDRLPLDASFDGPAVIEQLDTTILVEPGSTVSLDPLGNLELEVV
jgi:N-methylhydantoinase A